MKPLLSDGGINPIAGEQTTVFEYSVNFNDPDGGYAPLRRIYINYTYKTMSLKSGISSDGCYNVMVSGFDLNIGNNEYYFLFNDNEGNTVRLQVTGTYSGPYVNKSSTSTMTPTLTQTQTITETATPTITSTPQDRLRIQSPENFYYNTILLFWTPITNTDHYILELNMHGDIYPFDIYESWLRLTIDNSHDWQWFVDFGPITYRVSAVDEHGNIITGPTDWTTFMCK